MTEDRLDHIERLFRNPPSAAAMADIGLELVEALRESMLVGAATARELVREHQQIDRAPIMEVVADQHFGGARDRVGDVMQPIGEAETLPEAKPTPEVRPFKRKAK